MQKLSTTTVMLHLNYEKKRDFFGKLVVMWRHFTHKHFDDVSNNDMGYAIPFGKQNTKCCMLEK